MQILTDRSGAPLLQAQTQAEQASQLRQDIPSPAQAEAAQQPMTPYPQMYPLQAALPALGQGVRETIQRELGRLEEAMRNATSAMAYYQLHGMALALEWALCPTSKPPSADVSVGCAPPLPSRIRRD